MKRKQQKERKAALSIRDHGKSNQDLGKDGELSRRQIQFLGGRFGNSQSHGKQFPFWDSLTTCNKELDIDTRYSHGFTGKLTYLKQRFSRS